MLLPAICLCHRKVRVETSYGLSFILLDWKSLSFQDKMKSQTILHHIFWSVFIDALNGYALGEVENLMKQCIG